LTGIHDSNASLVPYLVSAQPFSVVSTGTWVVCMSMGGKAQTLDPRRDTLVNVNALGQGVPSARFMGGREYEAIRQDAAAIATQVDADRVLARKLMLLPSVVADCGPFPDHQMSWSAQDRSVAETEVALGYYLALMTAECLRNIGADGPTYIEGPFSVNPWYRSMLAAATGRSVIASPSRTGTAVGAALLFDGLAREGLAPESAVSAAPELIAYANAWAKTVEGIDA
jgi:sugar (pentulose or hexulose) kinase